MIQDQSVAAIDFWHGCAEKVRKAENSRVSTLNPLHAPQLMNYDYFATSNGILEIGREVNC
jgi:hypothetical protein